METTNTSTSITETPLTVAQFSACQSFSDAAEALRVQAKRVRDNMDETLDSLASGRTPSRDTSIAQLAEAQAGFAMATKMTRSALSGFDNIQELMESLQADEGFLFTLPLPKA